MLEQSESEKLNSHNWEYEEWKMKPSFKSGIDIYSFKCKECGERSYGSKHRPTVWATYVVRSTEAMSCNDVTVKDIII